MSNSENEFSNVAKVAEDVSELKPWSTPHVILSATLRGAEFKSNGHAYADSHSISVDFGRFAS